MIFLIELFLGHSSKETIQRRRWFNVQLDLLLNQAIKGNEKRVKPKFLKEKINMSHFFFILKSFGLS
jgi:hypothetical protein